jgi:hypothetical protein
MASECALCYRNAHTGGTHFGIGMHNLFGFPVHFHLFLGVIVFKENIDVRNDIHGKLVGKFADSRLFSVQLFLYLLFQFSNTLSAGTTGSLVSCYPNAFNFG